MFSLLGNLISEPIETLLETRKAKKVAQLSIYDKVVSGEIEWEKVMAKNSETSWKDEFWTVIFAIPLLMCFVPGLEGLVSRGFEQVGNTPSWYQYTLMTLVGASVGVRLAPKLLKGNKDAKKE